jgi:hypothetical protein
VTVLEWCPPAPRLTLRASPRGGRHLPKERTLADFLWLFEALPPGTSPTDEVTFTFTATVVRKG